MNIGVFDSGLGGLEIFRELLLKLPQYNYIFLGDNARVPYGGQSNEVIINYIKQAVDFLFKKNCKIIILACNTATAVALPKIQQEYLPKKYPDRRVLGVIRPTVEAVIEGRSKRVGVMGTHATIISQSFIKEFNKFDRSIEVFQQACPLLVPIIEEGEIEWEGLDSILKKYVIPLEKDRIDSLILGCTHYGLIGDKIQKLIGNKIHIISEGKVTVEKFEDYLKRHPEIEKQLTKGMQRTYYITALNERFKKMVKFFLADQWNRNNIVQLARI